MRAACVSVTALFLLLAASVSSPAADIDNAGLIDDEQFCKDSGIGVDGPALIEFFRKRTPTAETRRQIATWIDELDNRHFSVRQRASERLIEVGSVALPALQQALPGKSLELTRRAERCIDEIKRNKAEGLTGAAARLVRTRKPDGATRVLLSYLPFADDAAAEEELLGALATLAVPNGKPSAELVAALKDPAPASRAAAAVLVARFGTVEQQTAVCRLLADKEPKVRLRAAQGLLAVRDKRAVATLVSLVSGAPIDLAMQADDLLASLTDKKPHSVELADAAIVWRQRAEDAWSKWWKANEKKVDLAKVDVDLPFTVSGEQARSLARRHMAALVKPDAEALRNTADAPYSFGGHVLKDRQELEAGIQLWCQQVAKPELQKLKFQFGRVSSGSEYMRRDDSNQHLKVFIADMKADLRFVEVTFRDPDRNEPQKLVIVVRRSAGKARVIALGERK
jgi:hypothetical protein